MRLGIALVLGDYGKKSSVANGRQNDEELDNPPMNETDRICTRRTWDVPGPAREP
jgi:hypothetical protein